MSPLLKTSWPPAIDVDIVFLTSLFMKFERRGAGRGRTGGSPSAQSGVAVIVAVCNVCPCDATRVDDPPVSVVYVRGTIVNGATPGGEMILTLAGE
jgi:hypothetical protein